LPIILPKLLDAMGQVVGALAEEIGKPENQGIMLAGLGLLFGPKLISGFGGILKKTLGNTFTNFAGKMFGGATEKAASGATSFFSNLGTTIQTALQSIGGILTSAVNMIMDPVKALFKGIGEAIAGFFTALANPQIALGALMFAAAAAAIAAAILLIGGAIGIVTPGLSEFMNSIIIPLGEFIVNSFLLAIDGITNSLIRLTNEAILPLNALLLGGFIMIINTVTDTILRLTNGALIPLINTVSGSLIGVLRTAGNVMAQVGGVINGTLKTALEGIKGIVDSVGDAFVKMGNGIHSALNGVSGVLGSFRDIIVSIGEAIIAVVALATG